MIEGDFARMLGPEIADLDKIETVAKKVSTCGPLH
jgi:hypothetical protein